MVDVSVIVATYNWSSALSCALRSVQAQTLQDFEVLVVGDACSDDSADVVRSFNDPRMIWHNLEINHGSQWGPNNFGLRQARGTWIAYLGHDDIWHPDHLETLVETASSAGAIGAVAVMIMYGPPSSGVRSVAGLYADGRMSPRDFVPPSGLLHRRDAVDQIGFWTDANLCALPVDCEFETRLLTLGPIVSTNQLTVFKFNSASRRESYLRKNVSEQLAMLQTINSDCDFRHRELIGLFVASRRRKLQFMMMPNVTNVKPGAIHKKYRFFRGLDSPFEDDEIIRSTKAVRFSMERAEGCFEWYQLERSEKHGSFRWSGPSATSTLYLPLIIDRDVRVSINIIEIVDNELLASIKLFINDDFASFTISPNVAPASLIVAELWAQHAKYTKIRLELAETRQKPPDSNNSDYRWLGIAVAWVQVTPIDAV